MKAKRILAGLLGVAMICSLAACGSSSGSDNTAGDTTGDSSIQTVEAETDSAEDEVTDEGLDLSEQEITFEETTFVDNEYCEFTVLGVSFDEDGYCVLDTKLENRSSDLICSYYVNAINGVHVSGAGRDALAGETEYDETVCGSEDWKLDASGLEWPGYSDLELTLEVENDSSEILSTETFHIYPYGEENAVVFEPWESGQVVLDNDYMTITFLNTNMYYSDDRYYDSRDGLYVSFYIQNKSDPTRKIYLKNDDNGLLNGNIVSIQSGTGTGVFRHITSSGGSGVYYAKISSTELEENNIDTPESLELTFIGLVPGVYSAQFDETLFEETVSLTLQ